MDVVGQIVGGGVGKIAIREKSDKEIELGDLLIVEQDRGYVILQVYDLNYASQIPQDIREHVAGMQLEGYGTGTEFMEPELRNYILADAKVLIAIENGTPKIPKRLPRFFSCVRHPQEKDFSFLKKPKNPIYLGKIRSGSKVLDLDVYLDANDVIRHHILIPATTGRGKSNLVKVMLWSLMDVENVGILVIDAHDEYYGRHGYGLKDHQKASEKLVYYSPNALTGTNTLTINLRSIKPMHFEGIVNFTDPQEEALRKYYNQFGDEWIIEIVRGTNIDGVDSRTLNVLRRKFDNILGVYTDEDGDIKCRTKVFSDVAGEATVHSIVSDMEDGKIVVIDTSRLLDQAELLIGSMITGEIFSKYQYYKSEGKLDDKPVIGIVIEEAPRVLGKEALQSGGNIYSTIAREGRKFKVGLIAVTQLVSEIPRDILANMNTKIILGNELSSERSAIISSASQDLSKDDRTIASLEKGEAIVSSVFTKFAIPIKIPLFEDVVEANEEEYNSNDSEIVFVG